MVGYASGTHPLPTIVRDFQSVIGNEIKWQLQERAGKLPDAVIACVGGGSNAIGYVALLFSATTYCLLDSLLVQNLPSFHPG